MKALEINYLKIWNIVHRAENYHLQLSSAVLQSFEVIPSILRKYFQPAQLVRRTICLPTLIFVRHIVTFLCKVFPQKNRYIALSRSYWDPYCQPEWQTAFFILIPPVIHWRVNGCITAELTLLSNMDRISWAQNHLYSDEVNFLGKHKKFQMFLLF